MDCQLITSLHLGIYDGNIHSIKEIAEVFNINEEIVLEKLSKGISLFRTLVTRYQELFGHEFPTLNGENGLYLNLQLD